MSDRPVRVLQSFPHRIGAARICTTAWYQAVGVAGAGGRVRVHPGSVDRPLPRSVTASPTLARGRARIPYRLLGRLRAMKLHDRIVARRLPRLADRIDVVHGWPLGCLETLRTARELGIPTVLERPNAHTRFAYESVAAECERIGVPLPPGHEHAFDAELLAREEAEYGLADRILCPSDFVVETFLDAGYPPEKLLRHTYGYDERAFAPAPIERPPGQGLRALFVGVCAVRKGLHHALRAWLDSSASRGGRFLIAGEFLPAYAERLAPLLEHPSVEALGHRDDVPKLMRNADVLMLPSIEEGYGLACVEAIASGCVPLASDACTEICGERGMGLVHRVGDVDALTAQLDALDHDRDLLRGAREACLREAPRFTWARAGERLLGAYRASLREPVPA
jgi:glycosyltransferase involved in cell wall biosynthesis